MSAVSLKDYQEGDLIHVTYIREGGNGRSSTWEVVGVYLGTVYGDTEIQVSLRPLAGTATLRTKEITRIGLVADRKTRLGQRGDHRVVLPRRVV